MAGVPKAFATSSSGKDGEKEDECIIKFEDKYEPSGSGLLLSSSGTTSYSGTFNIGSKGFDPATMTVVSGEAKFEFKDDEKSDSAETYAIDLGASSLTSSSWNKEFSFAIDGSTISLLADLQLDGKLSYVITAKSGDFYFKKAELKATVDKCLKKESEGKDDDGEDGDEDNHDGEGDHGDDGSKNCQTKVPDSGSTLALMGFGLIGLAGLKRLVVAQK